MKLEEAKKIKDQLLRFEGKKDKDGFPFIWKIMISPAGMEELVMNGCKTKFHFDESFSTLNPNADFLVYVIGKTADEYTCEQYEVFIERNEITIASDGYDCDFCSMP
jgi:hypothetical protein